MLTRISTALLLCFIFLSGGLLAQNSDIVPKSGYSYQTNIPYGSHQELTDIVVSGTSLEVAGFTLRDGGSGSPDGDSNPTNLTSITFSVANSSLLRRIALYDAAGTTELGTEQVTGSSVVFSGLSISATDNGAVDFVIRVSFNSTVTDNQQFSFTVSSVSGTGSSFVNSSAGSAVSSTSGSNNKVVVAATKLRFVQQPTSVFINSNMTPAVTVEAVDDNNNRDTDNTSSIRITSSGTLTGSPVSATASSGLATFSTLQHSVAGTGLTLTAADNPVVLTNTGVSNTFSVSGGSDIIADPAFVYSQNIDYASAANQNGSIDASNGTVIGKFIIRDGGGVNDSDLTGTQLTGLTIDLGPNFAMLKEVELRQANDGGNLTGGSELTVAAQTVVFGPISGATALAADNNQIVFLVKATFKTVVTDNAQVSVTISNATSTSSAFAASNAGGATTSLAGDDNKIEVGASKVRFVQGPTTVAANVSMAPSVTIEAVDANNNRDLDNGSTVSVTSTGSLSGTPVTAIASNGLATFSTLTHTVAQNGRTLSAVGLTPPLTTTGASSAFNVTGTSNIIANTGFAYQANIPYDTHQEPTDITNTGTSLVVAEFDLQDGSGAADPDALPTVLTNLTLDLGSNFANLRRIALYDAAGTTELSATTNDQAVTLQTVSFTGLNLSAPDDGNISFTVRVSFNDPVTDNQNFAITVTVASAQAGDSQFAAANAGGAVTSVAGNNNRIEVTATKLKFFQDPSNASITVAMSPSVKIESVDVLDNRDLDNTSSVAVTSTGTLTGTPVTLAAVSGLATFPGLTHTVVGTGLTLSATASGPGLTAVGPSSTFSIVGGSDIITDGTFVFSQNIDYSTASNQNASIDNTHGTVLARFIIRDGSGTADAGTATTLMTDLTIDLGPNWSQIRLVELRQANDGNLLTGGSEVAPSSNLVTWTGISGATATALDNGNINFLVKVTWNSTVTDNATFPVTITAATATGSTFQALDAGGATTSLAGDDNKIEVTAAKLLWVTNASAVFVNAPMTPNPQVEAVDANNNRDLDYVTNMTMSSNGTLAGGSTNTITPVAGLGTWTNLLHSAIASNKNITAASGSLTNSPGSVNFNIVAAGSDIITNAAFVYQSNIPYDTYQELADIANTATSLVVAKFDIRDGSGLTDTDGFATTMTNLTLDFGANWANLRRVALFDAAGTAQLAGTSELNVAAQTVAFSSLTIAAGDNVNTSFTVRASFNDPVTDNQQFSVTVSAATATGSVFSTGNAGGATTSVASDINRIEVAATKLLFGQGPTNTYINVNMAPAVTVQSVDGLDNIDLDNASTVSITSTGTLTGSPVSVIAASGVATFPALAHSVSQNGRTLSATAASPGLIAVGPSASFNVLAPSNTSNIIVNAGFLTPTDIAYDTYQEATDIVASSTSLEVAKFDIQDGGGVSDADPFPTTVTNLTLDLGLNFAHIRRIALFDAAGTTELIGSNEQLVSSQLVAFSGLSLVAPDNGSISFTVRVSYVSVVTDNTQISFTINNTGTSAINSQFAAANAGGAVSSTAGNANRIEVLATQLRFVQQPSGTFINTNMTPAVTVESIDGLNNRDLDNGSNISITSSGLLTGSPVSFAAVNGLVSFAALQHSVSGVNLTLTAAATVPSLTGVGSNTFSISDGSDIVSAAAFVHPTNIPYETFQEPIDIINSTTSLVVAKFTVRDGGVAPVDPDLVGTTLTDVTFDLGPNFFLLRRVALFDATGTNQLTPFSDGLVGGQFIGFSGLSVAAPDDGQMDFTIRASFVNGVTDNTQFSIAIISAFAQPLGSFFAAPDAGGAVTSTAGNDNRIEVTATRLAFVQQPSAAYINVGMVPSVTVQSIDILGNRDLDNGSTVSITSSGTLTGSPVSNPAVNGLATFVGLSHSVAGAGLTLSATAAGPALTASPASSAFNILPPSALSNIVANGAFGYTSNVAYDTFQESANIVNSTTSLVAAKFDVQDGNGATDGDPFPTVLTGLTLDLGVNFGLIRKIALYDAAGTGELGGVNEQNVASQLVNFSGLNVSASDGGTASFTVRVSFKAAVTDNLQFSFKINNTTTLATNSSFASANAGGDVSSTVGNINRIEVTATKLRYVQGPTNAYINVSMSPAVTIEAVDALNNRDLDNASSVSVTSSGTLTGTPVSIAASSGLATFSTLAHSVAGVGLQLSGTSTGPVLTATGVSSTFTILAPSNASDIALTIGFITPSNIAYDTYQESLDIVNSTSSLVVGKFDLRDGAGGSDADPFGTSLTSLTLDLGANFGLIQRIALFDAAGTSEIPAATNDQLVTTQLVSFTGLTLSAADNGSTTFTVRVSFKPVVTDNLQFSVAINAASALATNSVFAAANAGGAVTSTASNDNRIEVTATKLRFVQQPTAVYINVNIVPAVTVETIDNLNNRDLDNTSTISITSSGTLTGSPVNIVASAGFATFSTLAHSVAQVGVSLTATSAGPALTLAGSTTFNVLPPSNTSNIIANTGFLYPTNITYETIQQNLDIVNSATSLVVAKFDVQDGGGAADGDAFPTVVNNITLDLGPNFAFIRRIALYDAAGTGELASTGTNEQAVAGQLVNFTGMSISAADGGSTTFSVRVSFKNVVTDNQQIQFTINNTSTLAINSSFAVPNAGAATSSVVGNNNRIEVSATQLDFIVPAANTNVDLGVTFPLTIQARDGVGFSNLDLDFAGTISVFSNVPTDGMSGGPSLGVTAFAAGAISFPSFKFTSGSNNDIVTLSITAGLLSGTSPILTLKASSNSYLVYDPLFSYNTRLAYLGKTTAGASGTSLDLAGYKLQDGDGVTNDSDGAPTNITSITFSLTTLVNGTGSPVAGVTDIQDIALYDAGGVLISNKTLVGGTVQFTGLSIATPTDDSFTTFTVRAGFKTSAPAVKDLDIIQLSITDITQGAGSSTFNTTGGVTSGNVSGSTVTSAASTPSSENQIDVVATQLDFTTQPLSIQGKKQPINWPAVPSAASPFIMVEARDVNAIVDLEHNYPASLNTGGAPLDPATTTVSFGDNTTIGNGKLDLTNLQYTGFGDGTLTVTSNSLTSAGPSISCSHVEVVNVDANLATVGVTTQTSLAGGLKNQVIYGVSFTAERNPAVAAGEPKLKGFVISFNTSLTDLSSVLKNVRVFESTNDAAYDGTDKDVVLALGVGTVTVSGPGPASAAKITVAFNGPAFRDLEAVNASHQATYFLVVDIDPNANNLTPPLQPYVVDDGYSNSATNFNVDVDLGSSYAVTANTVGTQFDFAAVSPPLLLSSYPATGQTNIDPTQRDIELTFTVPVGSMDGIISLYDQSNDNLVATMTTTTVVDDQTGLVINPIVFTLPGTVNLQPNTGYYVKIAQGQVVKDQFNNTTLFGIRDQAGNLYQGINYPGTLFFKTANSPVVTPAIVYSPTFATPNPAVKNISETGATIGATFDQKGVASYMVLPAGSAAPSVDMIAGRALYPTPALVVAQASFPINQTKTVFQSASFNGTLVSGNPYDVWMTADGATSLNHVTTIVPNSAGPFGADFVAGTPGPTLNFTAISALSVTTPISASVCKNTLQFINEPIVLNERNTNDFVAGSQTFYIVLPSGFSFDTSSGSIDFKSGVGVADVTSASISFLGGSVLSVQFNANATSFLDNITISGLRVSSSGSASGQLLRIGGSGAIGGITSFGTLSTFDPTVIPFDNSYSKRQLLLVPPASVVTNIPDNYSEVGLSANTVELIPQSPQVLGDYGTNTFSGLGVNINMLSLTAVTLGAPFHIVMEHTDENGCISETDVLYTVYDHNRAIGGLNNPPIYCAPNANFTPNTFTPPTLAPFSNLIGYNNLASYYMENLSATIPTSVSPTSPFGGPDRAAWEAYIQNNLLLQGAAYPILTPLPKTYYDFYFDVGTLLNAPTQGLRDPYDYFIATSPSGKSYYNGGSMGIVEFKGDYQSAANKILQISQRQNVEFFVNAFPIVEVSPNFSKIAADANYVVNGSDYGGTPLYCEDGDLITLSAYPAASGGTTTGTFSLYDLANPSNPIFTKANSAQVTAFSAAGANQTRIQLATPYKGSLAVNEWVTISNTNTPSGTYQIIAVTNNKDFVVTGLNYIASFNAATATANTGGFIDNGNGTATIDPSKVNNGYLDILVLYDFFYVNYPACTSQGRQIVRVSPKPVARFVVSTPTIPGVIALGACVGVDALFDGTGSDFGALGATSPSGATVTQNWSWNFNDNGSAFNISNGGVGGPLGQGGIGVASDKLFHVFNTSAQYNISLIVTSTENCESDPTSTSNTVKVGIMPDAKFSVAGVSGTTVADQILLTDQTAVPPGTVGDGVAQLTWDFDDGTSTVAGTPLGTVSHKYDTISYQLYRPTLDVVTNIGCPGSTASDVITLPSYAVDSLNIYGSFGEFESAKVYWQHYSLVNETFDVISAAKEVAGTDTEFIISNAPTSPIAVNDYVTISGSTVVSGDGKFKVKTVTSPTQFTVAYTFNANVNYTFAKAVVKGPDSWQLGTPTGTTILADATINKNKIWKTNLSGAGYAKGEKSALYSPSFDLTKLKRPMISFNTNTFMSANDGVVLQYSNDNKNVADPTKVWNTLGDIGSGVGWYLTQNVAGKPGNQAQFDYGWTGNDPTSFPAAGTWIDSKQALVDATAAPLGGPKTVFRFALGSSGSPTEGFGLDNVRLGERTRTILLESFVNTGNTNADELTQSDAVAAFQASNVGLEVVKLNYHVSFPGEDPFNLMNPGDPGARSLFYGVNSEPSSIMDGRLNVTPFDSKGLPTFLKQSLSLGQAELTIMPEKADVAPFPNIHYIDSGRVRFYVKVKATDLSGMSPKTALFVAMIEQNIPADKLPTKYLASGGATTPSGETNITYVVRQMLPDASGNLFLTSPLANGASTIIGPYEWLPDSTFAPHTGDLSIAVFLQDVETKQILQSEVIKNLDDPAKNLVTGLEPIPADQVHVFPVPSDQEMSILLPGQLTERAKVLVFDPVGRIAHDSFMSEGTNSKTISTADLAAGVYILQIETGPGLITRKKVVIVH